MDSIFSGLSLILVIGTLVALVMRLIGQPLIIGHILTGIIVGPAVLHITKSPDALAVFSDIGIALLLFIIGLGLNPRVVREVGRTASLVGVAQVGVITFIGWVVGGSLLGLSRTAAAFLGASLACSSTIIILKLLSDKKEQARLHGKIAISVSLVQDLFAIVLVVVTSAGSGHSLAFGPLISLTFKGALIGLVIYFVSNELLPRYQKLIAESQEFLFLFAIAWGLGIAALFAKAGLSSEIGALLAGISLASLPYAQEIAARLRPLRDFFLIVFFITLGAGLSLSSLGGLMPTIIVGLIIVVVLKPLVAMAVMGWLGYTVRTTFKASVALAQVSEFSIVLVVLGARRGLISQDIVAAITFITLASIAASTYLIEFSDKVFSSLEQHLSLFERKKTHGEPRPQGNYELVLIGYQKGGHEFIKVFKQLSKNFVILDYDPEVIDILEARKLKHIYGDVTDLELLEETNIAKAKLIVSTITDFQTSSTLLKYLDTKKSEAVVIAQADNASQATQLYEMGASYVILPHFIGSEKIGAFIKNSGFSRSAFKKYRTTHLKYLERQSPLLEKVIDRNEKKFGHAILENVAALSKIKPAKS